MATPDIALNTQNQALLSLKNVILGEADFIHAVEFPPWLSCSIMELTILDDLPVPASVTGRA